METRANFILIGAFTLAGLLGLVAVVLWFAQVELDRQFDYYEVRFSSVAGLSAASDVRFSGLPVGQVVDVRLSPDRDGTILVRVEVDADTPVREDSVATIEAQGVTGVSFVQIAPGSPSVPLLEPTDAIPFPEITAGRSVIQSLTEDAPELVAQTLETVDALNELFGERNRAQIELILANVAETSETFSATLEGFSEFAGSANEFASQIANVSQLLVDLSDDFEGLMQNADTTLTRINALSGEAETLLETGTATLNTAQSYLAEDLTATTQELRDTLVTLREEVAAIGTDARGMMATLNTTGATATTRLTEAETTLSSVDTVLSRLTEAIGTVDAAAARFDALLETEGAPLLSEARAAVAQVDAAVATIGAAAENDLPQIMADIRTAAQTASTVITDVGADLSAASGRIDALSLSADNTLATVTATFANANETLAAINTAMETGNRTLEAAEGAFTGADRLINEDLDGLIDGLQESMTALNGAIAQVSADIPGITADLRAAGQSAEAAFAGLQGTISSAGPSVIDFSRTGLPLYTRLAEETRTLVSNLDRLTQQIQRDPARFFLDSQAPTFRR